MPKITHTRKGVVREHSRKLSYVATMQKENSDDK